MNLSLLANQTITEGELFTTCSGLLIAVWPTDISGDGVELAVANWKPALLSFLLMLPLEMS